MDGKTYNGWTNYETWVTALWLDNDAGSSAHWTEQARECWEAAPRSKQVREWEFTQHDAATIDLAERLKSEIHDLNPVGDASLFADLMNAALSEVDWREIAAHYVDQVADETGISGEEGGQ